MQKQGPSIAKLLVAAGFALSCFALLLFLWVTFGGAVPFKPKSYTFSADFPEAITLQKEADVRMGGVSVGKVDALTLSEEEDTTRVIMEIDPEFAPISSDARAVLRQKTLLGETYVELTSGSQVDPNESSDLEQASNQTVQSGSSDTDFGELSGDGAVEPIDEGGHLEDSQVDEQVQIDEIFQALDKETRQAFQLWMRNSGIGIDGRGQDLNDAFGNLGPFSEDASDVLATLRRQEQALRGVVRNTGTVFEALTARDQELAGAIVGSNRTFRALASRDEALAETFKIFPTFQVESRLTLERLDSFARNARPLFRDLRPVARNLSPALRDLRRLSPNLRRLFKNLDPLIKASVTGIPALRSFLDGLRPVMQSLDPFLANLTPIISYLDYYAPVATDFLGNPAGGTAGALPPVAGQSNPRHLSRQLSTLTEPNHPETLSVYSSRLATNRGNGYMRPFALGNSFGANQESLFPSFDCGNTGATGGLGSGQVTPAPNVYGQGGPPSNPPASEGRFPAATPALPSFPTLFSSPPFNAPPFNIPPLNGVINTLTNLPPVAAVADSAFAPCVLQTTAMGGSGLGANFPAEFGGGRLPQVLADP